MNFLRSLIGWLIVVLIVLGCVAGLLFVPSVQTEIAHVLLGRSTGKVKISVDYVSTGLNSAHLEGVHVTGAGFDLTAPVVDIDLPMPEFLLHHRADIRRLVAKDWKVKGLEAALALSGSPMPWTVTVRDADLEGQVLVVPGRGKTGVPIDVVLKGGGLTSTRKGSFALDASGAFLTDDMQQITASAHGRLRLGLGPGQGPTDLTATLQVQGGGFDVLSGLTVQAEWGREATALSLVKDGRRLVALRGTPGRGAWSLALDSKDVAPFFGDHPPPAFSAAGAGDYRWDQDGGSLSATGTLRGVAAGWPFTATIAARHRGHELRVASLEGSVANIGVRALQPFALDETTRAVTFDHPAGDLARLSLDRVALERVPPLPLLSTTFRFAAGTASGALIVTGAGDQAYAVRSAGPLSLAGAAVARGGAPWIDHLDGRLDLSGKFGADQWAVTVGSFDLKRDGRPLLDGHLTATRSSEADQPWLVQGTLTGHPVVGELGPARATVDFTGLAGTGLSLDGKAQLRAAHDRSLTSSFHLALDETGSSQITLPLTLAFGDQQSDFVVDGTQVRDENGNHWYLKVSGSKLIWSQAQMLLGPFLRQWATARPFWGTGTGRLGLTLDRVEYGTQVWAPLDALVALTPTSVQLLDVRVGLDALRTITVTGGVTYDPAAAEPYDFSASLTLNRVESGPLFPAAHGEPIVEGRFKVKRTLVSRGRSLNELLAHPLQDIEASSDTSIVRALAVNVGDAVPQHRTSVGKEAENTAAGVASFIFQTRRNPLEAGKNPVTPKAEAVLNFTDDIGEIGFDRLTVDAAEQPDGSYLITRIDGATDELRVTGTGRIGGKDSDPLPKRPLSLDLHLAFRGHLEALLAKGGLIVPAKSKTAFVPFPHPVHLGGTVGQIDVKQWHDMLAVGVRGP